MLKTSILTTRNLKTRLLSIDRQPGCRHDHARAEAQLRPRGDPRVVLQQASGVEEHAQETQAERDGRQHGVVGPERRRVVPKHLAAQHERRRRQQLSNHRLAATDPSHISRAAPVDCRQCPRGRRLVGQLVRYQYHQTGTTGLYYYSSHSSHLIIVILTDIIT